MTATDNDDRAALLRVAVEAMERGDLKWAIEAYEEATQIGGGLPEGSE